MSDEALYLLRSVLTALALLSFLGIVFWAYSRHAKAGFDEAAQLPFADEEAEVKKMDGEAA